MKWYILFIMPNGVQRIYVIAHPNSIGVGPAPSEIMFLALNKWIFIKGDLFRCRRVNHT